MALLDKIRLIQGRTKLNNAQFAKSIGIPQKTYDNAIKGDNDPSIKIVLGVLHNYPDVSAEWLLRDKVDDDKSRLPNSMFKGIEDIPGKIIKCLQTQPKLDTIDEIIQTASQKDMVETTPDNGIPYFDEDFAGGYDEFFEPSAPDSYFICKGFERADCFVNVSGDSMSPIICNGDVIAIKKIDDISFLSFGEIYALVTTNGMRTIKRIRKGSDNSSLTLEPINKDYDSQEIPKKSIRQMFQVIGCLKRF